MASRSARPRLRAANIDLWVMTGLPSAVHHSFRRETDSDGESRVEKFVTPGFKALKGESGGVEEESKECVLLLAANVPLRVACRRSRRVLAASCSRLAASSFLLRTVGSRGRGCLLLDLILIVRMTGAAYVHRLLVFALNAKGDLPR
jgi:hypothetical protein